MAFENYPYTNFHELNLDWVLQQVVEFKNEWEAYKAEIEKKILDFETKIESEWSEYKDTLNAEWEEYKDTLNAEWEEYKSSLNAAWDTFRNEVDRMINEFEADIESRFTAFTQQINTRLNQFNSKIEKLQSDWHTYQTDMNAQWRDYKVNFNDEWADFRAAVNGDFDRFKNSVNGQLTTFNSKIETLQGDWTEYQSTVNQRVNELEMSFNTLRTEVNTFFDDLDVQQEVDTKIDAMVKDGTLAAVLGDIKGIPSISVFGGSPSLSDNKEAFEKAFENGGAVYIPNGIYKVSNLNIIEDALIIGSGQINITVGMKVLANDVMFYGVHINATSRPLIIESLSYTRFTNVDFECSLRLNPTNTESDRIYRPIFTGCIFQGAIEINKGTSVCIADSLFTGANVSDSSFPGIINILNSSNTRISGVNVYPGGKVSVYTNISTSGTMIVNSHFHSTGSTGNCLQFSASMGNNIVLSGCRVAGKVFSLVPITGSGNMIDDTFYNDNNATMVYKMDGWVFGGDGFTFNTPTAYIKNGVIYIYVTGRISEYTMSTQVITATPDYVTDLFGDIHIQQALSTGFITRSCHFDIIGDVNIPLDAAGEGSRITNADFSMVLTAFPSIKIQ